MATATKDKPLTDADEDWEDPPRSAEDAAEEPQEPEGPPPVKGERKQLSLLAGGEEPDSSSFKMRGGSVPVEGEFEKGDVLTVTVKLSVDEVHFVDRKDKDGYVVGTERRHIAKPLSIQRA